MKVDFVGEIAGQSLGSSKPKQKKLDGVAIGTVVANVDLAMRGRVQVHLDRAPDLQPWATVASPMAGSGYGFYAMPQIGDQVVVGFNEGDVSEPYVIGVVHKATDLPQILAPTEAITKRKMRTPAGHEIEFDDLTQALTITSSTQQKVSLTLDSVELSAGLGAASMTLTTTGAVTIASAASIELNAPTVTINGVNVEIKAAASATVNGGAACNVQGGMVRIN